jgi:DNA-binding response OmpR family regulator
MVDSTILTVTDDDCFLELLQRQLRDQNGGGSRMIVARTIDEACSLLSTARPRLIVVHWRRHGCCYEELNRLLWTTTVLAHRVPVLILADRYRTDQATTLFRMGVSDYISRTHHLDQFGRILDAYLRHRPGSGHPTSSPGGPEPPSRAWSTAPQTVTAQVV